MLTDAEKETLKAHVEAMRPLIEKNLSSLSRLCDECMTLYRVTLIEEGIQEISKKVAEREREKCAKIAEETVNPANFTPYNDACRDIADRIRES